VDVFPSFDRYSVAAVDLLSMQPVQTGSAEFLAEYPIAVVESKIGVAGFLPGGATLFDKVRVNTCVQNRTALKCAKSHAN